METDKLFEIQFGANLMCKISVTDNIIKVEAAVDGYGIPIDTGDIIIREK